MFEVIFLSALGLIWIIFATIQDLKKREIANWLNFSLIIFAIGFRFFYSLFVDSSFTFFYQGLIGLAIFFVLGNVFYYGKMFAGGDAKLMFALGAVLPFSYNFMENVNLFFVFLLLFFFSGAVYGLIASTTLIIQNYSNFKKDFSKLFSKNKKIFILSTTISIILVALGFFEWAFFYFGLFSFVLPYFYLAAKAVDSCCMVKKVSPKNLTEGDWLYEDVKIGNKTIKKSWDGLSKKDLEFLKKKNKSVVIRNGIPFSPAFLISFIVYILFWFLGFKLFL